MKDYDKQAELNLLELKKQKEESDKRLLQMEVLAGVTGCVLFLGAILLAGLLDMPTWLRILIIVSSLVLLFIMCFFLVRIEQVAGYYECKHCHHKYVPTYKDVTMAMHLGRTRYMKCPNCGKKSWQKKVISNE